jgi:D-serine deaminase-like pyridoxal phosphate-dependent protein
VEFWLVKQLHGQGINYNRMKHIERWFEIRNESKIFTPAVLVYHDRIEENIRRMIAIAGDAARLRPHVKTHKLAEVVQLQVKLGISNFKCATLSEVELVAENGGDDILLSYPLYGPGIQRIFDLIIEFPHVNFAVTVDSQKACKLLSSEAKKMGHKLDVFIDVDNGMHRTGIAPKAARSLANTILKNQWLHLSGLHVYDGHIHESDIELRTAHCEKDFEEVNQLINELAKKGVQLDEIACGGTFTFPIHAKDPSRTLCPGTPIFWDAGYEQNIPDLDFLSAAVLVGRVISKPNNYLCIDLGYKSLASEMTHPRLQFLNLEVDEVINHSEEHLVVSAQNEAELSSGDIVYALPYHVCPTIALHEQVYVVIDHKVTDSWEVVARNRIY